MRWFEEHKESVCGSDDEAPCDSYREISQISDNVLSGPTMVQFVREGFLSQKSFGEFLGVGESTVAGWMKTGSFPDYAKRATLAAYYAIKYHREIKRLSKDFGRPKVVKTGDTYMLVRFSVDEVGVAIGEVLARDIPTKKAALVFGSSLRAWDLIRETGRLIDHEIECMDSDESDWIRDLKDEIHQERSRVFRHDELLEEKRRRQEAFENLDIGDLGLSDFKPGEDKSDDGGEAND